MTAGVSLAGRVTDEADKPINGAEVGWLEANGQSTFHASMPVTLTRADGRFRVPARPDWAALAPGEGEGHAPSSSLDELDRAGHLTLELGRPRSVWGRILDSSGKPVPDAFINIDTFAVRVRGVFLKSDAEGRFRWDDAPTDEFLINISRPGFAPVTQKSISRGLIDFTLVLSRSLLISGADH